MVGNGCESTVACALAGSMQIWPRTTASRQRSYRACDHGLDRDFNSTPLYGAQCKSRSSRAAPIDSAPLRRLATLSDLVLNRAAAVAASPQAPGTAARPRSARGFRRQRPPQLPRAVSRCPSAETTAPTSWARRPRWPPRPRRSRTNVKRTRAHGGQTTRSTVAIAPPTGPSGLAQRDVPTGSRVTRTPRRPPNRFKSQVAEQQFQQFLRRSSSADLSPGWLRHLPRAPPAGRRPRDHVDGQQQIRRVLVLFGGETEPSRRRPRRRLRFQPLRSSTLPDVTVRFGFMSAGLS